MLKDESFVDILRSWATSRPEHTALTFLEDGESETHQLCYRLLDQRARETAVGIRKTVRVGDHVLLLHPPGLEFITAFFGCLYAGVVPVPAYPPRNPRHFPRIESIIADAGAICVLTETDFRGRLAAWLDQRAGALPVLCTDVMHDDADQWEPCPGVTPDTLAFLQYTSGSTGDPKGVMVTHGNLMANQRMIQHAFGHSDGLVQVSWLPVYHDMGLIGNLMQPLFLGGHCIFMSPVAFLQKPRRWLEAISHYRAEGSGGPNFALRLCTRSVTGEQKSGLDLSSIKVFFTGSEPINGAVLEEFAAAFADTGFRRGALYCCYGMAETTLLATGSTPGVGPLFEDLDASALARNVATPADPDNPNRRVVVGCGKAASGQELVIVDPQRNLVVEDGRVGEIWLRGANVARGYWRKPDVTREMFGATLGDQTGYLRTGDLGYLRDGELYVTGRMKDLIIIRGRNHYPQDIENTVDSCHAALAPSGCAATSVEIGGEESLIVIVEIQRSMLRSFNADEVFGCIRRAVFEQHELLMHSIVLIRPATLPRTSSGKVQRSECRSQFLGGSLDIVAAWKEDPVRTGSTKTVDDTDSLSQPETVRPSLSHGIGAPRITAARIEAWLRNWLGARLGVAPSSIDPDKAFADSGLDSVSGVTLTNDLSQWLGFEISATLVWDYPTIRVASQYLARQRNAFAADSLALASAPPRNGRLEFSLDAPSLTASSPQTDEPTIAELNIAESAADDSIEKSARLLAEELASLRDDDDPAHVESGVALPVRRRGTRRTSIYANASEDEKV